MQLIISIKLYINAQGLLAIDIFFNAGLSNDVKTSMVDENYFGN